MLNYYPLLCGCTPILSSVICPDVVGRGRSSRLANAALYGYAQYVADAVHLVGTVLALKRVHWIGTSMGGLIAMVMFASPAVPFTYV